MSETITEQEVLDAMNELGDEQTSDESDTAPDGDEGEAEQGDEQTEESEDADGEGDAENDSLPSALLSERDLEKRGQKIDAENVRHAKRLGEIMGDDAADLELCPMCSDDIAGFIYAPGKAPLSDEAIARVRMAIGMPVYDTLVQPPWAQACGDCQGQGKVKTGSVVPGKETTDCPTCGANGWINTRRRPEQNGSLTDPEGELITTGPTVFGLEPDERIASLREDGYTVIPPPTWTTAQMFGPPTMGSWASWGIFAVLLWALVHGWGQMAATDFNEASVDIQVRRLTRLARAHADYVEACAEIERTAADELAQAATAYVLGDGNATGNGEDSPPLSETAAQVARRRPYWLRSRYWLRRFHLIAPVDATRFGWSDNVQFPRIGTLPDGGSLKPSASTDTRERGTPTPETGTTAGCSSHLEHGSLFMDGYVPTWRPRVNSFTAPGSYGAGTVSLGESGGQRGAVT